MERLILILIILLSPNFWFKIIVSSSTQVLIFLSFGLDFPQFYRAFVQLIHHSPYLQTLYSLAYVAHYQSSLDDL